MKKENSPKRSVRSVAECVCGILLRDQRVLVEKRRDDDEADPGFVMLPGGHVERGESLKQALKREMAEELGIRVLGFSPVHVRYYTASNGERQRIHYFQIEDWKGVIRSSEAKKVYWEPDTRNLSDPVERKIALKLLGKRSSS